jgi:hypothetical protein
MNHRVKSLVVFGLVVLPASELVAQVPVSFGLGGGITIPVGSTSDGSKTGWHGLALVRFKPAASPVGFQVDGMYQRLGFSSDRVAAVGAGHTQIINGTADVVFGFPVSEETRFRPYLIGGVGVYNIKDKPDAGTALSGNTKFGINAGAGFDVGFGGGTFFVEGRFHNVFLSDPLDDAKLVPISIGVRFGGG